MKISVLRLGHRYARDKRVSTHICLVARAFGADEIIFDIWDSMLEQSIERVVQEWGGRFRITFTTNWKKYLQEFRGDKIHLTMYGINIDEHLDEIRSSHRDKIIIIGGKKVPSELYSLVDFNVAIGNQPHSEVAALAVFLDRFFKGEELKKKFDGRKKIIPQDNGKQLQ
ncbi:MAG: tRNA (cytidine(56)-2'-O)-methyltransferase [Candidatus Altiarchaeales archaeon]|nr:tRNA (cytidine(56)-2'-O)-methyltransferase [Candidatus Altiarchaeales archaeon]